MIHYFIDSLITVTVPHYARKCCK